MTEETDKQVGRSAEEVLDVIKGIEKQIGMNVSIFGYLYDARETGDEEDISIEGVAFTPQELLGAANLCLKQDTEVVNRKIEALEKSERRRRPIDHLFFSRACVWARRAELLNQI